MAQMINKQKILAIIPARGGSKRVPRKNIKPLFGKPLIAYTIDAAKGCEFLDRIIVSTDDREIAAVSEKFGAEVIERPKELAQDNSESVDVVLHALDFLAKQNYIPDVCVFLQPTSPLRNSQDIADALGIFLKNEECDTVLSVAKIQEKNRFYYLPDGATFVFSPEKIKKNRNFYSKNILLYTMPEDRSVDIDQESDFKLAEQILKNKSV